MNDIIQFPNKDVKFQDDIKEILDRINYPNKEIEKCIKDNITPLFQKYFKWKHKFIIELPLSFSKRDKQLILKQINQLFEEYIYKERVNMLADITKLQTEICKLRQRLSSYEG